MKSAGLGPTMALRPRRNQASATASKSRYSSRTFGVGTDSLSATSCKRTADQLPFSSAMMSAVSTTSSRRSGGLDAGVSVFATTLSPPMPKQDTIRWLGPPTDIVEERADVGHANQRGVEVHRGPFFAP